MKRVIIVAVVLLAVGGVLAAKLIRTDASPSTADAGATGTHVILVANLGEAGEQCGCGQMIEAARAVRGTAGVVYEEHDTRSSDGIEAKLKLKEQPAIVIVGADGKERGRFEGEDAATITAARAALNAVARKSST